MSNTIIITWVRNGMTLGTKWYGTKPFGYEMTRNRHTDIAIQPILKPLHLRAPASRGKDVLSNTDTVTVSDLRLRVRSCTQISRITHGGGWGGGGVGGICTCITWVGGGGGYLPRTGRSIQGGGGGLPWMAGRSIAMLVSQPSRARGRGSRYSHPLLLANLYMVWEREGEEEVGSGDPTSLPWPCHGPFESRVVIGLLIPKQTWRTQWEEQSIWKQILFIVGNNIFWINN